MPHRGKKNLGVVRWHGHIGDARLIVNEENFTPGLAAVFGAINAPIGVWAPRVAERADEDRVRIGGVNQDSRDLSDVGEPHELPRLAAVRREIDASAVNHIIADFRLARTHPHPVRVLGRERDSADRGRTLALEDGLPTETAVRALENPAPRRAGVINTGVSLHAYD